MKKTLKTLITIGKILAVIALVLVSVYALIIVSFVLPMINDDFYVTTNVEDYGHYKGNYDNRRAQNFINSFFPEKIEDYFSDVEYSYRADEGAVCAFEAYLEFVIKDPNLYADFIEEYTGSVPNNTFSYDPAFTEYVFRDQFMTYGDDEVDNFSDDIYIKEAQIAKILYCDEEQRIIFVALGVRDTGPSTEFLCAYFDRFNIIPNEYKTASISVELWEGDLKAFELSPIDTIKQFFEVRFMQLT